MTRASARDAFWEKNPAKGPERGEFPAFLDRMSPALIGDEAVRIRNDKSPCG